MQRWAWLVVLLYALLLIALAIPVVILAFVPHVGVNELAGVFQFWPGWIWIGVLVLCQAGLLVIPVTVRRQRLRKQRHIRVSATATGLALLALCLCGATSFLVAIWKEDGLGILGPWQFVALLLLLWLFWSVAFAVLYVPGPQQPQGYLRTQFRWLMAGSVLELLVAVPSHIIVRMRGDCCSPALTGLGIYTGLAVMLMAFGPGVYFLFTRRIAAHTPPAPAEHCVGCGYDLRGTVAAGLTTCPECGREIAPYRFDG